MKGDLMIRRKDTPSVGGVLMRRSVFTGGAVLFARRESGGR